MTVRNAAPPSIGEPGLTYIGGPTALIEWRGLRLLTDPTFDPAGTGYELPGYTLRKNQGPVVEAAALGAVDAVLLSHDHHFDNLDRSGRDVVAGAKLVITTRDGAERLGSNAVGLSSLERIDLEKPGRPTLSVTATPARHGPADADRGPVIGFVLWLDDQPERSLPFRGHRLVRGRRRGRSPLRARDRAPQPRRSQD